MASAAPPGTSPGDHGSNDNARFATRTTLSVLTVDRKDVLKAALRALGIHVIVEGRSTPFDGASQNINDGVT